MNKPEEIRRGKRTVRAAILLALFLGGIGAVIVSGVARRKSVEAKVASSVPVTKSEQVDESGFHRSAYSSLMVRDVPAAPRAVAVSQKGTAHASQSALTAHKGVRGITVYRTNPATVPAAVAEIGPDGKLRLRCSDGDEMAALPARGSSKSSKVR